MSLLMRPRANAALDENGEHWITTKGGNKVLLDKDGNPIKGNPKVVEAMKGGAEKSDEPKKPATSHLEKQWQEAIEIGMRRLKENPKQFADMRKRRDALVEKIKGKGDATYDLETGKQVSFTSGYQVTFQTTGSEDYGNKGEHIADEHYDAISAWMASVGDGKAYLGYFGDAEISFHFSSKRKAREFAKRFNQNSCWDWRTSNLVTNRFYDPKKNTVKGGEVRTDK